MNTSNLSPVAKFIRPNFQFMKSRASRWIALGFGAGLAPLMPGTVGTLWAWVLFLMLDAGIRSLNPSGIAFNLIWLVIIVASFILGTWACSKTGRDLGVADHGAIVWDEFVAFWLVLWVLDASQTGFSTQLGAFFVFRFFDMVKPPPIRYFDRRFKSGAGVMFDDILAAAYTLLVFAWWRT
jgi:phosphatidylglycerophosphatase A